MIITLINSNAKLLVQGINLQNGENDKLTSQLHSLVPLIDWSYIFAIDTLTINVPDGTVIPASMSDYGDVVQNDNPMG